MAATRWHPYVRLKLQCRKFVGNNANAPAKRAIRRCFGNDPGKLRLMARTEWTGEIEVLEAVGLTFFLRHPFAGSMVALRRNDDPAARRPVLP
jgi:hypothetical protein